MKAVILAGGLGTRLEPFTKVIPKPLLPLGEKSILEVQIEQLRKHGFTEITLATNYKSDYIKSFLGNGSKLGVNLKISKEDKPLGTCGPLTLIEDLSHEPFIVINGDILSNVNFNNLYNFAIEKTSLMTVATKEIVLPFQFGNIIHDGDLITNIEEKPKITTEIVAGIYVMKPDIFKYIPSNVYFGMDNLILDLLQQGEEVTRYLINEYWIDIGRIEDYNKAQNVYEKHFKPNK